jgi:hypothetical protein
MKSDHLRMGNTASGYYVAFCLHCGEYYVPALPVPLYLFSAMLKAFNRSHRDCKCPAGVDLALREREIMAAANVRGMAQLERAVTSHNGLLSDVEGEKQER